MVENSALVRNILFRESAPDSAVARDAAASIVWGMPGETWDRGGTEESRPLDRIASSARAISEERPS